MLVPQNRLELVRVLAGRFEEGQSKEELQLGRAEVLLLRLDHGRVVEQAGQQVGGGEANRATGYLLALLARFQLHRQGFSAPGSQRLDELRVLAVPHEEVDHLDACKRQGTDTSGCYIQTAF